MEAPVSFERLVERRVERACVFGPKRRDGDSPGRVGRDRRPLEVDLHPIETAHLTETTTLEERTGALVAGEHACLQRRAAGVARVLLGPCQELGRDPGAVVLGPDRDPVIEVSLATHAAADSDRLAALVLDEP